MNTSTLKQGETVSIIVPCYNEENTIQLMLEAICKQDFPISEIVSNEIMSLAMNPYLDDEEITYMCENF